MERLSIVFLCCALHLASGVVGSPPSVEPADSEIVILPVDPCDILLSRRTSKGDVMDRQNVQILALGCHSRAKRAATVTAPQPPKARDPRGLFKAALGGRGGLIYPGTKWCGPGNLARGYWDLGMLANEDRCCREHDYCPEQIAAGHCSHGICNTAAYTRSHCGCDERFRRCLQALKSPAADTIGALYFNVANVLCFAEPDDDNALAARMGGADMLEDRLGYDWEALELWPTANNYGDAFEARASAGCSRRPNCRYKFHSQKHYTQAASGDHSIPSAAQRPRSRNQEIRRPGQQTNSVMDKRGYWPNQPIVAGIDDSDHQAAEIISKFFHHILRSTGILRPRYT